LKGSLSEGVVPQLLRAIYVDRSTGWLHVSNGEVRHSLLFRRGHIVNARTNVPGERLGEMMVRRDLLTTTDLARATTIVIGTHRRLGAVLLEMGVIAPDRLEGAIETHVHELLAKLFAWTEGSYVFEGQEEAEVETELPLKVSTGELILQAVRAVEDPKVVREALGDTDRVLEHSPDPLLRFQKLTLSPTDGFVLSRIDGTSSAREIIQMIPLPAEEVERSLLNLLSAGVIGFTAAVRRTGGQSAAVATPHPTPAAGVEPPTPGATPPVTTPATTPAATPAAMPAATPAATPAARLSADDAESRRREILDAAQGLKERNFFEVLGVPRTAREADVKDAYFRLARRFHPDVHHSTDLADLRDQLEAVFIRLGEAYEVLKDPRKRADYEERLGRSRTPAGQQAAQASGSGPAAPGPAKAPVEEVASVDEMEQIFRAAARHFEAEHYWDAIQCLEPITQKAPGKLGSAVRVLLARCFLKNPNWSRRAEETLLAVTRSDPASVEAWALLATIYDEKGMQNRACSMYRKVLELKPGHSEASRYLATHGHEERQRPPDESPGVLRRLFRRS
jgi:hypothetical protein